MNRWDIVLEQLQNQMTPRMFTKVLAGTTANEPEGGELVIRAANREAKEWLEGRMIGTVTKMAVRVYEQELTIRVVNGPAPAIVAPAQPAAPPPPAQPEEEPDRNDDALNEALFSHEEIVGFAKHSHYLVKFGRAYLGAIAFDTWDFIRGHSANSALRWTEPLEITGIELARGSGCHRQRIVGVWRNCGKFDETYFETGEVLTECCGQYAGEFATAKPSVEFPQGRPVCRYWVHGALEILEAEGWAVYQKYGDSPRNTFYTVQIYQRPPILAPKQVARLNANIQVAHRKYLRGMCKALAKKYGLDWGRLLARWEAYDYYSLMALVEPAALLDGLTLSTPETGVLSAVARKNDLDETVLSATARNHIFFACDMCAGELNGN